MKIFLILLEREKLRREFMVKQLAKLGLEYEIIDAVDGSKFTAADLERLCDPAALKELRWWLTNGQIGCALSHYNVYKKIVELGIKNAFVIEDDAILPDNIATILSDIESCISKGEVINLYYVSKDTCQLSLKGAREITGGKIIYPLDPRKTISTAAYVIDHEAARNLAKFILPVRVGADSWGYFYDNDAIDSYACVYPIPCKVALFQSTLDYTPYKSFRSKVFGFIERNRVPGLYHLKLLYRKYNQDKVEGNFVLTNEVSPIYRKNQEGLTANK